MTHRHDTRREAQLHPQLRGRFAFDADTRAEAATRKRGRIIVRHGVTDRPFNSIDAAHMGQEDYRARKPVASRELFERRADLVAGTAVDDPEKLYRHYLRGHRGPAKPRR